MAELSKITLPSGTTYDIKDAVARQALTGAIVLKGVTSTALTDEATTNPITIDGESYTAKNNDAVFYGKAEFVFDGTKWHEFGDMSGLGSLALKNSASGTYTPAGTVSQPTFSGSELTSTGKLTPEGSVAISTGSGTANYTPAGSVSKPNFTGTEGSVSVTGTAAGSVAISTGSGAANYTPSGSVSKPNVVVTPTTDNVYSITDVGTLPALIMSVANENLTIGFSAGTLPTKGSAQSVMTAASAELEAAPTFSGTGVDLEAAFTGGTVTSTGTFTPEGSVSQPSFSGTGVELTAAFTGTEGNVSVKGTPAGTVSQPTFSGTQATITVE